MGANGARHAIASLRHFSLTTAVKHVASVKVASAKPDASGVTEY